MEKRQRGRREERWSARWREDDVICERERKEQPRGKRTVHTLFSSIPLSFSVESNKLLQFLTALPVPLVERKCTNTHTIIPWSWEKREKMYEKALIRIPEVQAEGRVFVHIISSKPSILSCSYTSCIQILRAIYFILVLLTRTVAFIWGRSQSTEKWRVWEVICFHTLLFCQLPSCSITLIIFSLHLLLSSLFAPSLTIPQPQNLW